MFVIIIVAAVVALNWTFFRDLYLSQTYHPTGEMSAIRDSLNLTGRGDDSFRIGPLKKLGDGSLGSRTAHLSKPYADQSDSCGFSLLSADQM